MSTPHNPSLLDPGQIIKASYDEATQRLRVDANITAPDGAAVIIDDADDSIKIGNGNGVYATITATGGKNAIDVNIAGGTITIDSVKITDSSGNSLNSTSGALNVQVENFPVTQPISGTVTANAGTGTFSVDASGHTVPISATSLPLPTGAATEVTLSSLNSKVTAVNTGAVVISSSALPTGASTATLQTQPGVDIGDVTINNASGASAVNIQDGGNSITVDGVFFQTTQPVSGTVTANAGTGNFTVTQGTGTNLHTVVDSGTVSSTQSGTWNITNVSGTVSLPTGASTSSLQTTGNTSLSSIDTKIPNNLTVTSTRLLTDGSGVTQPVSGTVTANAGTNLNTSLLALESGGNLASIKSDVDNLNLSQGSTTSGQKGNLILGAVTTSAPTYTTAQSNPLSLTTAGALRTDSSAITQPVSGTVIANAGSGTFTISGTVTANAGSNLNTSALALDATLTGGTQQSKITDGTNVATVKAASTAAIATDKALVVAISPNNSLTISNSANGNTGSAVPTQATQVGGSDGTNLRAVKVSTAGVVSVDGSATTQPIAIQNKISTVNSTSTPLAAGATFTGTGEDVSNYGAIQIFIFSDVQSATDGLKVEWSIDNSHWDIIDSCSWLPSSADFIYSLPVKAQYFRIIYINNATTPQTYIRLQTALLAVRPAGTIDLHNQFSPTNQPSGTDGPILLGTSVNTGTGTFAKVALSGLNVGVDGDGNTQWGLSVFDFSNGKSNSFGGPGTPTPPDGTFTNGSGNQEWNGPTGNCIFLDISGTWTGSLTIKQQPSNEQVTLSVRQVGTGTLVSSITANGLYTIEGEAPDNVQFINGVATGQLDLFAYSIAGYTSGMYVKQAGTWNINNISGTVSLPTNASTSALQTTGNTSLSSIDGKLASLGQKAMTGSEPVVIASDQSAIPVTQSGNWDIRNITGTITLPSLAATSTKQSDGSQKTQIVDGSGNIIASTSNALNVNFTNTSITDNQGTPNTVSNAWPIKITDGTDTAQVNTSGGLLTQLIDSNGNNITSSQFDIKRVLDVQDINSSNEGDYLRQILIEMMAMRLAIVSLACSGNQANPEDFDPQIQNFGLLSEQLR